MIVLDTHAWIWWSSERKRLSRRARYRLRKASHIGVPAISCWEVAMLVHHGRVSLDREIVDWLDQALGQNRIELLPLTPAIAVTSTRLGDFHGDPADRLIVATAIQHSARLISQDRKVRACPLVESVW